MQPDIIVTLGSTVATLALQRETRTIPIVFVGISDPVATGIPGCCALAAIGHTAVLPRPVMNVRRLIE